MTSALTPQELDQAKMDALASFLKASKPKSSKTGADDSIRITTLSDSTYIDVDVIPTGSLSLDHALGVGGFPKGRIIELYGPTGGGKTTLALEAAKECQLTGGVVGFVDAEQALNRELVDQIGIDGDRFVIAQTDTGEQAIGVCENMINSGAFDMIIIDSAAAMVPRAELEAEVEQQHMGLQARLLSKFMRRVTGIASKHNVCVVIINQIRANLGAYGAPDESTGGKAIKFFSSVRVEVRTSASKQIKEGTDVVGTTVTATVKKNKFAAPFKKCDYTIMFGKGIDATGDVFNVGVDLGVIAREGNTYYIRMLGADLKPVEVKLGVGGAKAKAAVEEDEEMFAELEAAVRAKLAGHAADAVPLPEEVTPIGGNMQPNTPQATQAPAGRPQYDDNDLGHFGLDG